MDFSRRSRSATSAVLSPIWPNFEHIRDRIVVLVTYKNENDPIKNEGARVLTTLIINFSDAQGQLSLQSVVFKLVRDIMVVLVTCKNEEDPIKSEGARVLT